MRRITRGLEKTSHDPSALVCPDSVEVHPRHLVVGDGCCASFAITGYPREVGLGWLAPLLNYPGRLDVSLHVDPFPAEVAAQRLRRQQARLESDRRIEAARGRLADPGLDAAATDAAELAGRVMRGEAKLFRVGLYLSVFAHDRAELDAHVARVKALCASLLMEARPASFRALQGFAATLPIGVDALRLLRTMDTDALQAAFPFVAPDLSAGDGVLYGTEVAGSGLVRWDRFSADNANAVILARSGAGKSYLAKLEALRSLYRGIDVLVVDPEDEYRRLAAAAGGAYLHLGAEGVRLNPFDLIAGPEALVRRALFVHTFLTTLAGALSPRETAALDRAVLGAYGDAGITTDPRTHARPAPTLADLARRLDADGEAASAELAARLAPYVSGSHKGLFDGPTTTSPEGHLVVFSLRDLPDELKAAGTLLAVDACWRRVADPARRRRRLVVVDEAWLLMRDPAGARFLFKMAKAARKHWCGLTVVTQDAADLLSTDLGQAVVANAATQVLLRQAPQAIEAVGDAFALSEGERAFLLSARRGEGLLCAGASGAPDMRVGFQAAASEAEHRLVTSDPAELAGLDATADLDP